MVRAGMIGRDVQRLEVVPVVLDLGTLGYAVAHPREHVDDPVLDERERMERAGPGPPAGQRDVDGVGREQRRHRPGLELRAAVLERRRGARRDLVREPAERSAFVLGSSEPSDSLDLRERRLAAEHRDLRRPPAPRAIRRRRNDQRSAASRSSSRMRRASARVHGRASLARGPRRERGSHRARTAGSSDGGDSIGTSRRTSARRRRGPSSCRPAPPRRRAPRTGRSCSRRRPGARGVEESLGLVCPSRVPRRDASSRSRPSREPAPRYAHRPLVRPPHERLDERLRAPAAGARDPRTPRPRRPPRPIRRMVGIAPERIGDLSGRRADVDPLGNSSSDPAASRAASTS